MPPISIIIPVWNEESILEASVFKLSEFLTHNSVQHEILIVDNGSTDSTREIGESLARKNQATRFFSINHRSVGEAFKCGVKNASHDFIVTQDADLSSDLDFLLDAQNLLLRNDIVVGCKSLGRQRRNIIRLMASQCYIIFSQLVFGLPFLDYSLGCKAYRRASILPALDSIDSWTGYPFELCLYLHLQGKRITQVSVSCEDKRKSHFNLLHEGVYRYRHLFKCWLKAHDKNSWFHCLPRHGETFVNKVCENG